MSKKDVAGHLNYVKGCRLGQKVTLRGGEMYEFLEDLVNICGWPRVRDFQGIEGHWF